MAFPWKRNTRAKTVERKELIHGYDGDINSASLYYDNVTHLYEVRFVHDWNRIWKFTNLHDATKFARKKCGL